MTDARPADDEDAPAAVEHVALSDADFKTQLAQVIPHLRAFGRSLSGSRDLADDLVQETLMKALAKLGRIDPALMRLRQAIALKRDSVEAWLDMIGILNEELRNAEAVETLDKGSGTCRDFALFMMEAARSLGFAARFVSGYLYDTTARGGDETHAWVQIYLPGAGWVEFDPTNGIVVQDEHVVLAWGRDFTDISPLRGVLLGGGEHELDVRVDLEAEAMS